MAKIKARITNNGRVGGFTAEIMINGEWKRINRFIGGGLVSFDSREQALKAIRRECKKVAA